MSYRLVFYPKWTFGTCMVTRDHHASTKYIRSADLVWIFLTRPCILYYYSHFKYMSMISSWSTVFKDAFQDVEHDTLGCWSSTGWTSHPIGSAWIFPNSASMTHSADTSSFLLPSSTYPRPSFFCECVRLVGRGSDTQGGTSGRRRPNRCVIYSRIHSFLYYIYLFFLQVLADEQHQCCSCISTPLCSPTPRHPASPSYSTPHRQRWPAQPALISKPWGPFDVDWA